MGGLQVISVSTAMTVTFVLGVGIGGAGGFVLGCLSSYRAAMKAARPLLDEARRSLETSTQALQEARRRDQRDSFIRP
jgi:hypothetical protein